MFFVIFVTIEKKQKKIDYLLYGRRIREKGSFKSFIPFLVSIILCGGVSFGLWKLLLVIHPGYKDILHGFTYNGYTYIAAFVFLNLWLLFKIYKYFLKQEKTTDLLIAPIFIWLINNLVNQKYKLCI